jgi:hypothetical protein
MTGCPTIRSSRAAPRSTWPRRSCRHPTASVTSDGASS